MLPKSHKMWEIVEEQRFEAELSAIEQDPIRADQFIDGAKNILCRNPQAGTKIGEHIWFIAMARSDVVLYYTFDDVTVNFQSIQRIPNLDAEEDDETPSQ